ncbi:hypothetical protein PAMP_006242 [Pampus punctatissimus]
MDESPQPHMVQGVGLSQRPQCIMGNVLTPQTSSAAAIGFNYQFFLSGAIRQPDTEVQPNSHLLQSQEHNVQIKKVENSLPLISMQRLPVHLLAANESSDTQRLVQYENSPLQTASCPYCHGKVIGRGVCSPTWLAALHWPTWEKG